MLCSSEFCSPVKFYKCLSLLGIFALAYSKLTDPVIKAQTTSRRRFKNQYLNSSVIKNVEVRSVLDCVAKCSITENCKSVNHCVENNTTNGICVLNTHHLCDLGANAKLTRAGCEYLDFLDHTSEQDSGSLCTSSTCQNGGTCTVLCGKKVTMCECRSHTFGDVCQHVNGGWSMWGAWSRYADDILVRYRDCNSPVPQNGGKNCPGKNYDLEYDSD